MKQRRRLGEHTFGYGSGLLSWKAMAYGAVLLINRYTGKQVGIIHRQGGCIGRFFFNVSIKRHTCQPFFKRQRRRRSGHRRASRRKIEVSSYWNYQYTKNEAEDEPFHAPLPNVIKMSTMPPRYATVIRCSGQENIT